MTSAIAAPEGRADMSDDLLLINDPLALINDVYYVRIGDDLVPLLHCDLPFHGFLPGWRADALFTGFAPLFLLELVNTESGARATWFLDQRMQMMGDQPGSLRWGLLNMLKLKALPLLQSLMTQTIERVSPVLDARMKAFLRVNRATKAAIATLCIESLIPRPFVYQAGDLMQRSLIYQGEDQLMRVIDRDHLAAGLRGTWQDRIAGFIRSGHLTWPSPVDGHLLNAQGSFVFDDFHFAYRFADSRNGLVFYVLVADHLSRIAGLWFPAMGLMVADDPAQLNLARLLNASVPHWFVFHTLDWAENLVSYLRRGATRFASVMRGPPGLHLGHQLWNELSGIERMVRDNPDALPDWIAMNAAHGGELYGPIDTLFPELAGRIERHIASIPQLIAHAYAEGLFILRVTDEFVSAALRHRILNRVDQLPITQVVRTTLAEKGQPLTIVIGLRVENRTLSDLEGALHRVVTFLAARYPGLVVVFDGHNALVEGETVMLGSHGEESARRRPIDVEFELVSTLRASCAGQAVTILDTIGASMSTSLAWTAASDAFISIWGASLAKYRWVCNKPGYVVSNRTNLMLREALHIYSAARYMEAPSPLVFVSPDYVTDDQDAVQLVNTAPGDSGLLNFQLDLDSVLAEIGSFVDTIAAARRVAPERVLHEPARDPQA